MNTFAKGVAEITKRLRLDHAHANNTVQAVDSRRRNHLCAAYYTWLCHHGEKWVKGVLKFSCVAFVALLST